MPVGQVNLFINQAIANKPKSRKEDYAKANQDRFEKPRKRKNANTLLKSKDLREAAESRLAHYLDNIINQPNISREDLENTLEQAKVEKIYFPEHLSRKINAVQKFFERKTSFVSSKRKNLNKIEEKYESIIKLLEKKIRLKDIVSSEKKVLNTPTRPLKEDIKKYQKQISTNQKLIKQAEEIIRKLASFKQFKHLTGFEKENYIDGHWKHIDRLENKNELLREKMEMLEKKTEKVETLRAEKRRH